MEIEQKFHRAGFFLLILGFFAISFCESSHAEQDAAIKRECILFKRGDIGFHTFRIPAIVRCADGSIAAFAEARKDNSKDSGRISIAMRKSSDGGKTWTPIEIVADGGGDSCGNPVPIVDKRSGDLILIYNKTLACDTEKRILSGTAKDMRRTFIKRSRDNGNTWEEPRQITQQVKLQEQTWFAIGPSGAIQIEGGKFDGRIVCPVATATSVPFLYWATAIFSDDGGNTWQRGNFVAYDGANESQIAQIDSDTIAINMRIHGRNPDGSRKTPFRVVAMSRDGGRTWGNPIPDPALPEPICEASFTSFPRGDSRILAFSNPADTARRVNMTLRFADSKKYLENFSKNFSSKSVWTPGMLICDSPSGYSDTLFIDEHTLGIIYERGVKSSIEEIAFSTIAVPKEL